MTNPIQKLVALTNAREQAKSKRYNLIGQVLALIVACEREGIRYNVAEFDRACDILLASDTYLLEAMVHSHTLQLQNMNEGADTPVLESSPTNKA